MKKKKKVPNIKIKLKKSQKLKNSRKNFRYKNKHVDKYAEKIKIPSKYLQNKNSEEKPENA